MARDVILTLAEAALVLNLTVQHVRNLLNARHLKGVPGPGMRRVYLADVISLHAHRLAHPDGRGRPRLNKRLTEKLQEVLA